MNARDFLQYVQDQIRNPKDWCQGAFETYEPDTKHTRRCAEGARMYAAMSISGVHVSVINQATKLMHLAGMELLKEHRPDLVSVTLNAPVMVNDQLGHEAVMEMLDRAKEMYNAFPA